MSRNPYATPADFEPDLVPEQRTSILAISSLVVSLICCLPGTGVIGAILGVVALLVIAGSQGRLAGRGAAIAGIIVGVLTTVVWIGVAVGMLSVANTMRVYGDLAAHLTAGKPAEARTFMAPSLDQALTDDQLIAYGDGLRNEWGSFSGMPDGLAGWFSGYSTVGPLINRTQPSAAGNAMPLPITFDQGTTLVWMMIDDKATPMPGGMPRIRNMAYVDRSGQLVWLVQPGSLPPPAPGSTPPAGGAPDQPDAEEPPADEPPADAPAPDEGGG